jgi:hypothetical protein
VPTPYATDTLWKYVAIPVGAHPASAGRYGHEDLVAGLGEYLRDTAAAGQNGAAGEIVALADDEELETFNRAGIHASWQFVGGVRVGNMNGIGSGTVGFRCGRDLPR